ncbi:type VII secretion protein EccE [Actinoallomurus acanthiterrae]
MAAAPTSYRRYTYTFGPRESGGVFLGLGMGSILALFGAVFLLTRLISTGLIGTLFGLVLVLGTVIAVWVPVGDRPIAGWLPIAIVFAARRGFGYTEYRGGPAAATPPPDPQRPDMAPLELPGELAGLSILTAEVATHGGTAQVGVIKDRRRATYTLVLATRGGAFQLLDPEEQDARLVSWGETLAGIGNAAGIVRVQLLDTTVPDSGDALIRGWGTNGGRGTTGTYDSYQQLLQRARPVTQRHENHVAIMLSPRKARAQIRHLGGGDKGACQYLLQQAQNFQLELQQAGVEVDGALPPRQIAMVLRTAYEPGARWGIEARGPDMTGDGGADGDEAGPAAASARWSYYRTDDSFHATFWIAEWPRRPVIGPFLEQLLLHTTCERTVSIVMEPREHRAAEDDIGRRETAQDANRTLRARLGFRSSAKERHQADALTRQDDALASGHTSYRFLGLIRVSAPTLDALDEACSNIAVNARNLKLRRLYGEQDSGFAATLPLCRGLRFGMLQ